MGAFSHLFRDWFCWKYISHLAFSDFFRGFWTLLLIVPSVVSISQKGPKTISILGVIEMYEGAYQVKVVSPYDITIH